MGSVTQNAVNVLPKIEKAAQQVADIQSAIVDIDHDAWLLWQLHHQFTQMGFIFKTYHCNAYFSRKNNLGILGK